MIYQLKDRIEAIQFTGKNHSDCRSFAKRFNCKVSIRKNSNSDGYNITSTGSDGTYDDFSLSIGDYLYLYHHVKSGDNHIIIEPKLHFEDEYEESKDELLKQLMCCNTCYHAITPTCCDLDECKWEIRKYL